MKYIDAQFQMVMTQVLYRHAEIVSGAYKFRGTQVGCGRNDDGTIKFRDLTDDEKLQNSMQTMQAQIHRLTELADHIGASKAED